MAEPDFWDKLMDLEHKSQGEYDRLIVTLAGGSLGISFAFVDSFIGDGPARLPVVLMAAWGAWVVSLVAILVSHLLSAKAFKDARAKYGKIREGGTDMDLTGPADTAVGWLNLGSLAAFGVGTIAAGIFVFGNLTGEHRMAQSDDPKTPTERIEQKPGKVDESRGLRVPANPKPTTPSGGHSGSESGDTSGGSSGSEGK